MKKTKDEPVGATGAGTEVVIGGSVANEVDSNNTNKDNNKKQGTLRKIFTRKQSEVWKDGEVSKDKVEVVKDKDTDKDKQKDKDKDKDKDTAAGGAALLRPKRPERIKPLGRALTIASIAPPVSPRIKPDTANSANGSEEMGRAPDRSSRRSAEMTPLSSSSAGTPNFKQTAALTEGENKQKDHEGHNGSASSVGSLRAHAKLRRSTASEDQSGTAPSSSPSSTPTSPSPIAASPTSSPVPPSPISSAPTSPSFADHLDKAERPQPERPPRKQVLLGVRTDKLPTAGAGAGAGAGGGGGAVAGGAAAGGAGGAGGATAGGAAAGGAAAGGAAAGGAAGGGSGGTGAVADDKAEKHAAAASGSAKENKEVKPSKEAKEVKEVKEKEKEKLMKEKERAEKAEKEREKAEKEKEKVEKEKADKAEKERLKEKERADKEKEKADKEKEKADREKEKADREREKLEKEREKEAEKDRDKKVEKDRERAEKEREKAEKEREKAERDREKIEKERERQEKEREKKAERIKGKDKDGNKDAEEGKDRDETSSATPALKHSLSPSNSASSSPSVSGSPAVASPMMMMHLRSSHESGGGSGGGGESEVSTENEGPAERISSEEDVTTRVGPRLNKVVPEDVFKASLMEKLIKRPADNHEEGDAAKKAKEKPDKKAKPKGKDKPLEADSIPDKDAETAKDKSKAKKDGALLAKIRGTKDSQKDGRGGSVRNDETISRRGEEEDEGSTAASGSEEINEGLGENIKGMMTMDETASSESTEAPQSSEVVVIPFKFPVPEAIMYIEEKDDEFKLRNKVINEIINTELLYVEDLKLIQRCFLVPLRDNKILQDKEVASIFSNLELILAFNRVLLEDLIDRAQNHGGEMGACFLRLADYMKIYSSYCSNQQNAHELISGIKKRNEKFKNFLEERRTSMECRMTPLEGFLIKPVQRICKYPLLLREMIKNTPTGVSADIPQLESALTKIGIVVGMVNENKRTAENSEKIFSIQQQLEAGESLQLLSPTRRFVMEGKIAELTEDRYQITNKSYYFLFNDILLRTKKNKNIRKKNQYKVQTVLSLDTVQLKQPEPSIYNPFPHSFEINDQWGRRFILAWDTEQERTLWFAAMEPIVEKYQLEFESKLRKEEAEGMALSEAAPSPPPKPNYLASSVGSVGSPIPATKNRRASFGNSPKPLPATPPDSSSPGHTSTLNQSASLSSDNLPPHKKPLPPAPLSLVGTQHSSPLSSPISSPTQHAPSPHRAPPAPPRSNPPSANAVAGATPASPISFLDITTPTHTQSPNHNRRSPVPTPARGLPSLPPAGTSALPRLRCHLHTTAAAAEPVVRYVDVSQRDAAGGAVMRMTDLQQKIRLKYGTEIIPLSSPIRLDGIETQEHLNALLATAAKYIDLHVYISS